MTLHDVDGSQWVFIPCKDHLTVSRTVPAPVTPENPLGWEVVQKIQVPWYLVGDVGMSMCYAKMQREDQEKGPTKPDDHDGKDDVL